MKNILVLLADFANGIFAVMVASWITQTEIIWWYFLVGIPLAMLPDIDAVPELFNRGKISASSTHSHDHRDAFHFPILFLLIAGVGVWQFGFWGWMFLVATQLHFLNDLYGTGWGIPLMWPFSRRRYKLLGRRANQMKSILVKKGYWKDLAHDERRLQILVTWSVEELPSYITKWGMDDWIDKIYLRLNWISFIEYSLFTLALVLVVSSLVQ